MAYQLRARGAAGARLVHQSHWFRKRGSDVTSGTTRLGMTGGTTCCTALGLATVERQEIRRRVRGRRREGKAMDQGAVVARQGPDGRDFRGIDVAVDAEVLRVAGGAARRHGGPPIRSLDRRALAMATQSESLHLVPGGPRKTGDSRTG